MKSKLRFERWKRHGRFHFRRIESETVEVDGEVLYKSMVNSMAALGAGQWQLVVQLHRQLLTNTSSPFLVAWQSASVSSFHHIWHFKHILFHSNSRLDWLRFKSDLVKRNNGPTIYSPSKSKLILSVIETKLKSMESLKHSDTFINS